LTQYMPFNPKLTEAYVNAVNAAVKTGGVRHAAAR